MKEINWMAGGPQGAGVDSAANIFGRACGYGGLYVYGRREYHSNIKGLHSYFHLRVSDLEVQANVNDVNLLAAFDAETVVRHISEVVPNGGIIVDKEQVDTKVFNIATLPYEFKDELRKYVEKKGWGETLNDFLEGARERRYSRLSCSVYGPTETNRCKTQDGKCSGSHSHGERSDHRRFVCTSEIRSGSG